MTGIVDQLIADREALAAVHGRVSAERDTLQTALVAWPDAIGVDPLDGIKARASDLCAGLYLRPRDHDLYLASLPQFAAADATGGGEYEDLLRFRHLTYWHDYVWMLEVDGQRRLDAADADIEARS